MFLRILKKDLQRKKAMNGMLLAFIIISTLFLAASVTNFVRSNNALQRFAEMSGTADYYMFLSREQPGFDKWLENSGNIIDHEATHAVYPEHVTLSDGEPVNAGTIPYLVLPGERFNLVFDKDGNQITSVQPGEIAISIDMAEKNDLLKGNTLDISLGNVSETFTVAHIHKDYAFGHEGMDFNRAIVSQSDYDRFSAEFDGIDSVLWSFSVADMDGFINDKNHQNFFVGFEFQQEAILSTYHLEQISSVVMLVVSAVLIAISISLLGFTIRFTIEEDFREIGVMKAIGIKDAAVRQLYLIKYLSIAVIGAVLGSLCTMPFAELLIVDLAKRIVLIEGREIYVICVICAISIVGLVMLFCWQATSRIHKATAIQAIREGSSGERFRRKGVLRLRSGKRGSVALFMACNDIFAGLRNYVIIFLALVAGLQLILLPFNALTTLKSGDIVEYFVMSGGDYYAGELFSELRKLDIEFIANPDFDTLVAKTKQMENDYAEKGVNVSVNTGVVFMTQVYVSDMYDQIPVQAVNQTNGKPVSVNYLTGTPPQLHNEIAMTNISMDKLGVEPGDSVHMVFGEDDREYIITASFESMMNGGESIVLSPEICPDMMCCIGVMAFQIDFHDRENIPAQIEALKAIGSDYTLYSPEELIGAFLSSTISGIEQMITTLTIIALSIIALVTFLICNTLMARDKSSIALLKSIGFSKRAILVWQTARIVIIALAADIAGVSLSFVINPFVTRQTFGIMGAAGVPTRIDAISIFGLFPALFLVTTTLVALLASHTINKIDMRNVGSLE